MVKGFVFYRFKPGHMFTYREECDYSVFLVLIGTKRYISIIFSIL